MFDEILFSELTKYNIIAPLYNVCTRALNECHSKREKLRCTEEELISYRISQTFYGFFGLSILLPNRDMLWYSDTDKKLSLYRTRILDG